MHNSRKMRQIVATVIALILFINGAYSQFQSADIEESTNYTNIIDDYLDPEISEEIMMGTDTNTRIAVLEIEGAIIDDVTFRMNESYNHDQLLKEIKSIKEDPSVKGVLLKVDSPGGGVYESKEIHTRLKELKEVLEIPIYTNIGNLGASGGYYISSASDKIYASEESVVGSIGVIMSGLNFSGLLEEWGITDQTIKTAKFKDTGSSTRPMDDEEKAYLQETVDRAFERFVNVVSEGRKMPREEVLKVAEGKTYDGLKAKELGLIDEIGYFEGALADLSTTIGAEDPQVFRYSNTDYGSIFNSILNSPFLQGKRSPQSKEEAFLQALARLNEQETQRPMYLLGGE